MERHFASKRPLKLKSSGAALPKGDYIASSTAKSFAIAVDAGGKLHWKSADLDGGHLIVVVTQQAEAPAGKKGWSMMSSG